MIKFGTDGWRGIIGHDFNEENVKLAAQAIAKYLNDNSKTSLVVGYDNRNKADEFAKLTSRVLVANNIKVYLVDKFCPTPVTGWSIIDKKTDGAIMFTASHNPAEFLGLKFMTEEAMVAPSNVTDQFVANLALISAEDVNLVDFDKATSSGQIEIFDPKPSYFAKLNTLVDIKKLKAQSSKLKVLINPMHGAGVGYLKEILSGGNIQVEEINGNADPSFGGLPPEPIVEKYVQDAIEKVKMGGFDVCLSSDGDSDRIGLIDEKGQMLSSLEAFLLLTYYIFEIRKMRGPIVRTLSNTSMVDKLAKLYSQESFEVKVGFKYVGEKMKEVAAVFGGEESGGSAINNFMLVRDAQIMNLFILDLMVSENKPLSQILVQVEEKIGGGYKFKRIDIHFDYDAYEEIKNKKAPELVANPPKEILGREIANIRSDDGVKFNFGDDSWLLIRFSGTEPVLRTYAEAKTIEEVDSLLQYAKDYFK